jgi:hypothetical protein
MRSPGATKRQAWYRTTGIARNSAAKNARRNGVNNGEATSIATIFASPGRRLISGSATK